MARTRIAILEGYGAVSRKPKRRRLSPPTAKQREQMERFRRAAAECKGKPGYRACVARELKAAAKAELNGRRRRRRR